MRAVIAAALMATSALATAAPANGWQEREQLELIRKQLQAVHAAVAQAEVVADPSRRLRFDYDALKADLTEIEVGIEHYLTTPMEPAEINDLSTNYGEYGGAQ